MQSLLGMYSSAKIEIAYEDEGSNLWRLGDSSCFLTMAINFQVSLLTFCMFLMCSIWLIFFNEGPSLWFQNHYFVQNHAGKSAAK